jgi:hypothetical protein
VCYQGIDGARQPSELEIKLAVSHGEAFGNAIKKVNFA